MGRPSPKQRKAKRQRQKVKRKLVFSGNFQTSGNEHQEVDSHDSATSHGVECRPVESDKGTSSSIGDVDCDVMEMALYDDYRQIDKEPYPPTYLFKCREKLISKVKRYRGRVHKLEKEVAQVKLESTEEKKRLRKYYEVIAFGKSRSGKMVRSAMGTAHAAGKIMKELEMIFSVDY